jgi:RNA polymerase sigma factor, sigma-70 family
MDELERQIIKDVLAGHIDRYDWIVHSYSRRVFALIARIVTCREDVEELTQDTFIKAFDRLADFRGACAVSTWIYRIAYTTAISHARRRRVPEVTIDDSHLLDVADSDVNALLDAPADAAREAALTKAIGNLAPDERALITLHYFNNLSLAEVAQVTGLTLSNVKVKLMRIRRKLYLSITHEN